jgi:serine/threonine-protein kinase
MICLHCQTENEPRARVCRACGRDLDALALADGTVLARRYELRRKLGEGGMGVVWRALDRKLELDVAIKFLRAPAGRPSGSDMGDEMRRRFREEVRLAREVSHKNVCRIHDYGEDGELAFISMELVEGGDLKRRIRTKGPPDWEDAYAILLQVGEGLAAIHEAGLVHRDLKLANIMRDARGRVKLMDFGIAKAVSEEKGITESGLRVGSPEYMSPEQVRGEPRPIDARSDLYAFGVVVYELLTGRVPFPADTPLQAAVRHLHDEPVLEGPEADRIPAPLVPVLRRALAKDRGHRYATCREMVEALVQAQADHARHGTDPLTLGPTSVRLERDGATDLQLAAEKSYRHPPEAALLLPMLARASRHAEARIRAEAAVRLGRIGGAAARAVLLEVEQEEDDHVRAAVASALRRFPTPEPPAGFSVDLSPAAEVSPAEHSPGSGEVPAPAPVDETSTVIVVRRASNGPAPSAPFAPSDISGAADSFELGDTPVRPLAPAGRSVERAGAPVEIGGRSAAPRRPLVLSRRSWVLLLVASVIVLAALALFRTREDVAERIAPMPSPSAPAVSLPPSSAPAGQPRSLSPDGTDTNGGGPDGAGARGSDAPRANPVAPVPPTRPQPPRTRTKTPVDLQAMTTERTPRGPEQTEPTPSPESAVDALAAQAASPQVTPLLQLTPPPDISPPLLEPIAPSPTPKTDEPASAPVSVHRGQLVELTRDVTPPRCLQCRTPELPDIAVHPAARARLKGDLVVVLRLLVDDDGRVEGTTVVQEVAGASFLTEAARKAVSKWRWEPARKDDVPVRVWWVVRIRFELPR